MKKKCNYQLTTIDLVPVGENSRFYANMVCQTCGNCIHAVDERDFNRQKRIKKCRTKLK